MIAILFSADLIVSQSISLLITLNGFIQFLRKSVLAFRDATGTFYNDRWKPLIEGIVNVVLSVCFVKWIGITGVIIATIITNLVICHIVEPYVLYKNAFSSSPKRYYIKNYGMIALFCIAIIACDFCMISIENPMLELIVNGFTSVGISTVVCGIALLMNWKTSKCFIKKVVKR